MVNNANWLLPEGVEEILPTEALKLEMLRRKIIDDFTAKDFSLVMPPIMEFADALLSGTGTELDTQTYKFMDQQSNRMLGIRADITPQIARIDSHYLVSNEVNRLCYASTVLRAKAAEMGGQRELLQCGVEIFGVSDTTADKEVLAAMLSTLEVAGVSDITVSLAHVDIYRALVDSQALRDVQEQRLQDTLLRKSAPDLKLLNQQLGGDVLTPFQSLMNMKGGLEIIDRARSELPSIDAIGQALDQLSDVVDFLKSNYADVNIHLDLADVAGYRYYTGIKYAAFIPGRGRTVAKGGRYDHIGEHFGRARPATGFSVDLKTLVKLA